MSVPIVLDVDGDVKRMQGKDRIGPLASTAMACAEADVMDQETRYLSALQLADTYRVDAMTLEMFDDEGTRLVQFQRAATP